ncbi:MAG: Crp/Fnr family transcriptional regulator [Myxococcaceae bacterium]|nr:Crp/Fnr family transcriptional regulator [Myxococcaceae bacterium]
MAVIAEQLSKVLGLPVRQLEPLLALAAEVKLPKGDFFTRPGERADRFAIVLEGLVRHYYVDARGKESVKAFRGPLEVSGPYAELISGRPSRTFIQALAPARLLCLQWEVLQRAADASPELSKMLRRFAEAQFVNKEQREYEFLQLTAEERYLQFCRERKEHLGHVPLHQIASYIGITPVALSRIRARLARKR